MAAYYNEIDPYCAAWLRNLIAAGHIAAGDVDERSIEDVRPDDLREYDQCHFFAGIGVWSSALRLAGWADDRPVWTGSCPCQPFSAAGQGAGFADERHLWPAFFHLIEQCHPAIVFGEQVASKDVDPWIDLVQTDLEGVGYAVGAVAFPSAGVGAPHIRDRTYWVADAQSTGSRGQSRNVPGATGALQGTAPRQGHGHAVGPDSAACCMADAYGGHSRAERKQCSGKQRQQPENGQSMSGSPAAGPTNGFWRDADWLFCRDDKWRPVEPGTFPLVDGAPSRVGRLRAYGNAINREAALAFINAAMTGAPS